MTNLDLALGIFSVGAQGVMVADAVYEEMEPNLSVAIPDATAGEWRAFISHKHPDRKAPHRSLVALHASVATDWRQLRWEEVEWDLTCDSCDVVISDTPFRALAWPALRALGSGDALVVADGHVGGAKAVCCYDPWRCEVAVCRQGSVVIGVRVRWYSSECERIEREYVLDGVVHWLKVAEGGISVLNEENWYLEHGFYDLHWLEFDEMMSELKIPEEYRAPIHAVLVRHGAVPEPHG